MGKIRKKLKAKNIYHTRMNIMCTLHRSHCWVLHWRVREGAGGGMSHFLSHARKFTMRI